ncbi:MAG: ligase-associated DNA damage response DEXH box helicase [Pirellulaceae bacterium]|nr:ligase-associated DNA damage response DEXH box helicase [Pirellulaceae bacterium]
MRASPQRVAQATRQVTQWFESLERKPFAFQRRTWRDYLAGRHGLVHAQTGTGKTLAAFLGPVIEHLAEVDKTLTPSPAPKKAAPKKAASATRSRRQRRDSQLRVLWITPLRALAGDTETNLRTALTALGVPWLVEKRTSDSSASLRARQQVALPEVLITTPESITLQLTREDCIQRFAQLRLIVVDEWHELLGSKRGVQTELALARLRTLQPAARVWGLSATIGNLDEALVTLVGPTAAGQASLVRGNVGKQMEITALIPRDMERFPWAGHLGGQLVPQVAEIVRSATSSLVFTNTRSQAEIWYRSLLAQLPDLAGQMAVHHGSLDQKLRWWIEDRLRDGRMRCCVCTSSLELGVDFPMVDQVVQIGSPKGCARLIQRAGRSGHRPGQASRVTFVPTHALELVEIAALKRAVADGHIERRAPLSKPLDVLAQHVVTVALGGGFRSTELLNEVRGTAAYAHITDQEWQWVLDFAERGGSSLTAYPDYHRIALVDGTYRVLDRRIAALHRMSVGTIVSDAAMQVRYMKGKVVGTVEESFVGRMSPGDRFMLGGKLLELVRVHDNTAWVKRGRGKETAVPRWMGGRMPLSTELSQALRDELERSLCGKYVGPAMQAVKPMLQLQLAWSTLPAHDELLVERWSNREGHHLFVYPFEGRLVHEGLAALWAYRLSRLKSISFSMAMNDYGFVLVSPIEAPLDEALAAGLLSSAGVAEDILSSLNATEMSKRQFREIARVAGLLFQGYPGQRKQARHLQASSNLFYDVFSEYDPENLLLRQARREVLERQLEEQRMIAALDRLGQSRILIERLLRPTPLAFPLLTDRLRDRLSSESFAQRVQRLVESLEQAANNEKPAQDPIQTNRS